MMIMMEVKDKDNDHEDNFLMVAGTFNKDPDVFMMIMMIIKMRQDDHDYENIINNDNDYENIMRIIS